MRSRTIFYIFSIAIAVCFICIFAIAGVCGIKDAAGYVTALEQGVNTAAESHAWELLCDLYGNRVAFRSEKGDGINYLTRYYCANICIDACTDGSIRYLCDIRNESREDRFLTWLFHENVSTVLKRESSYGMEYLYVKNTNFFAELCLNLHTGRVFAAKITFNS